MQGLGLWWGPLKSASGRGGVTLLGATRGPPKAGVRAVMLATGPVSGGGGVGIKHGGSSTLSDRVMPTAPCWRASVGCGSVQAMSTWSRCEAAMGRGWWRSTAAMVADVIISMVYSGDGARLLGVEQALGAATHEGGCGLLSRRRGRNGGVSLSVESTA